MKLNLDDLVCVGVQNGAKWGDMMRGLAYCILGAVVASGCVRQYNEKTGGPIAIEKKIAECSSCIFVAGTNRTVTFKVVMEYPGRSEISEDESGRLIGFVDSMFNGGTNFEVTVNEVSRDVFKGIREASTNAGFNAAADLDMAVEGKIVYADARYLSYELNLTGLCSDHVRCTYDRVLNRPISIDDIVPTNRYDVLRGYMRDYLKMGLCGFYDEIAKGRSAEWPMIKDAFSVDESGVTWTYSRDEIGFDSWMEISVGWDKLKEIVDPSVVPPGEFKAVALPAKSGDAADWWRFPYYKTDRMEFAPPNPPYSEAKYPHASVTIRVEDPARGGMSTRKYNALQHFLARTIAPCGSKCIQTVKMATHESILHFWKQYLLGQEGKPIEDGYGIYELETAITYRGPEYVSYKIRSQTGCPCCSQTTNVVWNWLSESPLRIEDVIEMGMTNELKRIMRDEVRKSLADEDGEVSEAVLPDYAKDWPRTFDNFSVDTKGLSWWCDAGEVLIGGKGAFDTTLTWEQLRPFLRMNFVVPTR